MSARQVLLTRAEFEWFILHQRVKIYVSPYEVQPCDCRDVNCHGWRLAAARPLAVDERRELERLRRST